MTDLHSLGAVSVHPDCYYGDHDYQGSARCVRCGHQPRCVCGQFVRIDDTDHFDACPVVADRGCPLCEGGRGMACSWHFA